MRWWLVLALLAVFLIGFIAHRFNKIESIKDIFIYFITILVLSISCAFCLAKYFQLRDDFVVRAYQHNEYEEINGIYVYLPVDYD